MTSRHRVIIIGAGLIGQKRGESIKKIGSDEIVGVCDVNLDRARDLAKLWTATAFSDYSSALRKTKADIAVVATTHKTLPVISYDALNQGLHVLCEKPLGRNATEVAPLVRLAKRRKLVYKCGFNHRYHPAILQAKHMAGKNKIGPLMYVRARYGHGGRPGYDKEWRADSDIAGGGELLDQGIHIIDLARWFLGDFTKVMGMVQTAFWDMKPLEDNGFALLQTKQGQTAFLHASWTQWKNIFSFEIFGRNGALTIDGLGKSYGVETLTWARRKPESGPPDIKTFEFPEEDQSWIAEWRDFLNSIKTNQPPLGSGADGLAALTIIDQIYAQTFRTS